MKAVITNGKPKCPECAATLEGMGFPMPSKGVGRCPAGSVDFTYEIEQDVSKHRKFKDKFGEIKKVADWVVKGDVSNHKK